MQINFTEPDRKIARSIRFPNQDGKEITLSHAMDNLSQAFLSAWRAAGNPEHIDYYPLDAYKPENRIPTALQKGAALQVDLQKVAMWLSGIENDETQPPSRLRVKQLLQEAFDFLSPDNESAKHHRQTILTALEAFQLGEIQSQKTGRG